jgi:hypothetical protein
MFRNVETTRLGMSENEGVGLLEARKKSACDSPARFLE